MTSTGRRAPLVTLINGAVAILLVVVLAVVALVVKPPSPPGIAEFAPQATKPISKAPPDQAAEHGSGPGSCAVGQSCAIAPSASSRPVALPTLGGAKGVPSELQCYEWGDGKVTQTFDPQSPPCIATWPERAKGNGGATSRGVTRSEIQVTISRAELEDSERYVRQVIAFLNSHYQLYERKLRLVVNEGPRPRDASAAHALAAATLSTEAFAAVLSGLDGITDHELAQHKMISISRGPTRGPTSTAEGMRKALPYVWSYEPPADVAQRNLAAFVCTSLKGKRARFSPETSTLMRKFIVHRVRDEGGSAVDAGTLQAGLRACGIDAPLVTTNSDENYLNDPAAQQRIAELKAARVTTVLTLEGAGTPAFPAEAEQGGWRPEWVYYGKDGQYPATAANGTRAQSQNNRLGLAPTDKLLPEAEDPYYRAAPDPQAWRDFYTALQILAAGAQMAGPRLTPQTFAQGLIDTTFPNPGAGGEPSYQAAVGFTAEEPWAIRDFAVWWTDTSEPPKQPGGYRLCFVDRGRRWALGAWTDLEAKIKGGLGGC